MFRFLIGVAALFGIAALIFGGSAAGLGVAAAALFLAKVVAFLAIAGVLGRLVWGAKGGTGAFEGRHCGGGRATTSAAPGHARPAADRFEEWHRMAHARQEVDSWTEDIE